MPRILSTRLCHLAGLLCWLFLLVACVRPNVRPLSTPSAVIDDQAPVTTTAIEDIPLSAQLGTAVPSFVGAPTPDPPRYAADAGAGALGVHRVAAGETLGLLAQRYDVTVEELMALNDLANPDLLHVGQTLQVPGVEIQQRVGPDFKVLPDSELVYGPATRDFDVRGFAVGAGGFLPGYREEVERQQLDGPAIVQLVADRHSVNPRLLLALLEYRTGWVTEAAPRAPTANMGYSGVGAAGLYGQLSWAANLLNFGFYGRAEAGLRTFNLGDDSQVFFSPLINDGTAGVQLYLGAIEGMTYEAWREATGPDGFFATYERLFGNPFGYSYEPILPADVVTPPLVLPWPQGETWYLTSGPHGAWNTGSAWGALDFVPPAEQVGCIPSDAWVTAMADGVVSRSGHGAVVVDMDGDGYAGTGWAITYMHLETRDRAALGAVVKTGDRLGHPSCEGGFSNGTHLHVARSYNGRWISADGPSPFVMSGWVSSGAGAEYDGYLTRGEAVRGACVCREEINAISH
jgi:LysM repeat protein